LSVEKEREEEEREREGEREGERGREKGIERAMGEERERESARGGQGGREHASRKERDYALAWRLLRGWIRLNRDWIALEYRASIALRLWL